MAKTDTKKFHVGVVPVDVADVGLEIEDPGISVVCGGESSCDKESVELRRVGEGVALTCIVGGIRYVFGGRGLAERMDEEIAVVWTVLVGDCGSGGVAVEESEAERCWHGW